MCFGPTIPRLLDRDDMVMTTMSTFVSMTAHCARCHNHKFDPIPQEDYYALQSVFAGVERAERPVDRDPAVAGRRRQLLRERRAIEVELRPLREKAATVSGPEIESLDARIKEARAAKDTALAERL